MLGRDENIHIRITTLGDVGSHILVYAYCKECHVLNECQEWIDMIHAVSFGDFHSRNGLFIF